MTNSAPEANTAEFTSEEVRAAELAEQAELTKAQNAHLTRRVVVLRTQLNRVQAENEVLRSQLLALTVVPEQEDGEPDPENSPEG